MKTNQAKLKNRNLNLRIYLQQGKNIDIDGE